MLYMRLSAYFGFSLRECCTKIQPLSRETNRNLTIPEPYRLFHPNLIFQLCSAFGFTRENQTSLNSDVAWLRSNFNFSFCLNRGTPVGCISHPNDRRDKPASFGQIAFVFDKIEKLLLPDQRKPNYEIKISHNQG